jgi:adenine phosphoribosyltransferase
MKGVIAGFSFIVSLDFLGGKERLKTFSEHVFTLAKY